MYPDDLLDGADELPQLPVEAEAVDRQGAAAAVNIVEAVPLADVGTVASSSVESLPDPLPLPLPSLPEEFDQGNSSSRPSAGQGNSSSRPSE